MLMFEYEYLIEDIKAYVKKQEEQQKEDEKKLRTSVDNFKKKSSTNVAHKLSKKIKNISQENIEAIKKQASELLNILN